MLYRGVPWGVGGPFRLGSHHYGTFTLGRS